MKKLSLLFLGLLICICSSCFGDREKDYAFLYDIANISTIEIGVYNGSDEEYHRGNPFFDSHVVVEDIDAFIADFNLITSYAHVQGGIIIEEGELTIKITYLNNEYELIQERGQLVCIYKDPNSSSCAPGYENKSSGLQARRTSLYFDQIEFAQLLEKYLN